MSAAQTLADGAAIETMLDQIAARVRQYAAGAPWAVVGIRRGGDVLGARLATRLQAAQQGRPVPLGVVDITLYRDDGFGPHDFPQVGQTHIPFDLKAHTVLLVDDVLFTGRTVRAALDVLADFGRPKAVRLAVLVDRGRRELPIHADVVGMSLRTQAHQHVEVALQNNGAPQDAVWMHDTPNGHVA